MTDPAISHPPRLPESGAPGSTRCQPLRAVHLLPDGQVRVLTVSHPVVLAACPVAGGGNR
jgi:hypothetical protein